MAFGFLKNVVKVVAAPVKLSVKVAVAPGKLAAKVVRKVPVVGKPLSSVVKLGNAPLNLASHVVSGERIDQAVLNNIKSQVKQIKDVAPYAKMVVTLVPGVGTGLGAAISAGCALAEGQSITTAFVEGIKGAIPGGPLAQSAFNIAGSVASGGNLQAGLIAALPTLTPAQKSALSQVVTAGRDLAAGKSVNKVAMEVMQNQLPADVRKAVNIGIAVGKGQQLQKQKVAAVKPDQLTDLANIGSKVISGNATLKAGYSKITNNDTKKGFAIAIGLMQYNANANEITTIQNKLNIAQKTGFATGLAARVGLTKQNAPQIAKSGINPPVRMSVRPVKAQTPEQNFGQAVAHGLEGATVELKKDVLTVVAKDPQAMQGVVDVAKKKASWLHQLLVHLHLIHEEKAA